MDAGRTLVAREHSVVRVADAPGFVQAYASAEQGSAFPERTSLPTRVQIPSRAPSVKRVCNSEVECDLPKIEVASPTLAARSKQMGP